MAKPHTKQVDMSDQVGHRARLRAEFLRNGYAGMDDYKAIELLLTFFIPRLDVKTPAKRAVERFGSFRGVLDATPEELSKIDGIGRIAAENIRLVRLAAEHYLRQGTETKDPLVDIESLHGYCRMAMGSLAIEQFRVFYVDGAGRITKQSISDGTVDRANVFPREVMHGALTQNAVAVIVAHNHPTGDPTPSEHDKMLTRALALAAETVGVRLHDHLIVAADAVFSFRSEGLL